MRIFLFLITVVMCNQFVSAQCTIPTISVVGSTSFCQGGSVVLNANTGTGYTYQWYNGSSLIADASNSSFAASASGNYKVIVTGGTNGTGGTCVEESPSINVSVSSLPIAPATPNNFARCGTGTLTLSATAPSGSTIDWYAASTGGSPMSGGTGVISFTTPSISVTTIYYAESRNNTTGCVSSTRTAVTATVNAVPGVGNISLTICSGAGFSEIPQNGGTNVVPAGTQYSWTVANDSIDGESISSSLQSSISQQSLVNITTSNQVLVYTVTPQTSACPGSTFTISVTVSANAIPVVNDPLDQSICAGSNTDAVNFIVSPVIPNAVYNWTSSNTSIGIGASGSGNIISFQTTNSTNAPVSSSIQVTPSYTVSGLTCTGVAQTFVITVKPLPTMTSSAASILCSGDTWSIALNSNITSTYTWQATSNNNVGGESTTVQASATVSDPLTNTTTIDQVVNYLVIPTANGCPGSTQSVSITVKPRPSMTSSNSLSICSGTTLSLPLTSNILSTYTWQATSNNNVGGESTSIQLSSTINNALTNATLLNQIVVYSVIPTSNGCPGSAQTVSITVKPLPSMTSSAASSLCTGDTWSIALNSNIISAYTWQATSNNNVGGESTTVQTSATVSDPLTNTTTIDQVVNYSVIPTANGCAGSTQSVSITVKPRPSMTSSNSLSICSGETLSLPLSSNISSTYSWQAVSNNNVVGENLTIQNNQVINNTLSHLLNTNQIVEYTVTPISNGCAGANQTVAITIKPKPSITSNLQQTICSEQPFTFIPANITNGIVPATTTLTWTVNNSNVIGEINNSSLGIGEINQTLTNTNYANNQVIYAVTPTANSCVGDLFNYTVTVNKAPNLIVTPTSTICDGNSIQLFAVDAFNSGQLFYNWSNANTLNSSFIFNPIATPQSNTTYTVSATDNTTLCQVSRNVIVNVLQQVANITFTSPTTFCQGGSVTLSANSGAGLSYQWKLDGNVIPGATSASYPAISSGVYTVDVTNSSGCSKTSNGQTVIVYPLPVASISSLSSTTFCAGESVVLTTTALPGNSYQWYNGTSVLVGGTSATYSAATSGLYSVMVTNNNTTCVATSPVASVTVNALPTLNISADDSELCVGESTSLHVTGASSYSWNPASLVSNSSNANPNAFPSATTNFGVTGTDQNGCIGYSEIQITVVPNPTLELPATLSACAGSIVSLPGSAAIDWSGITSLADFTAQQSGYAIATLQNSNSCTTKDSIYLQVHPLPTPDITGSVAVCANAFYSEYSVVSSGNAYSWNVSNGELQGVDNGNTAYIHWYDMEYGPSTFVTMTEHDNITGCEGSDTLFVTFSGLAPNTTNVNLLDPSGSTLYSEDHFAFMNWGATIISNNVDEYTSGHAQYYTFENFDTALRYYWIEAGDDSLCLTRSYYNAPIWQVGIEENQDFSEINLYPNPTSDYLNISVNSNFEVVHLSVYDLAGKLVKQEGNIRHLNGIDVNDLPAGYYLLKLQSAGGEIVNKTFVKE